jgi:hypothetical protein
MRDGGYIDRHVCSDFTDLFSSFMTAITLALKNGHSRSEELSFLAEVVNKPSTKQTSTNPAVPGKRKIIILPSPNFIEEIGQRFRLQNYSLGLANSHKRINWSKVQVAKLFTGTHQF